VIDDLYDDDSEELWRDSPDPVSDQVFEADIARFRREIDAGNKGAILDAIAYCIEKRRPIHRHIAYNFLNSYFGVRWHRYRSWDDVFGRPVPKGAQLIALRRHRALRMAVAVAVEARVDAGEPIDKTMFDAIAEELRSDPLVARDLGADGKKLKIGGTLVSEVYDECKKELFGPAWPKKNKDFREV
jgi:hypothetical protein